MIKKKIGLACIIVNGIRNRIEKELELLINDIFDVYKLDIGRLKLKKKSIEVASLVQENVAELKPLTEDKQIEFKAEIISPYDEVNVLVIKNVSNKSLPIWSKILLILCLRSAEK